MRMPGTVTSIPNQDSTTISDGRRTTVEDPDMNPASETAEGSCSAARDEACLQSKHKVLLSYSSAQKGFVEQLCVDLERCDRYPFYDKRRDGLERDEYSPGDGLERDEYSPEVIFRATRQCQVGVLILSEEFFTATKWPMLELAAMVDFKKQNWEFVILPVFLHISKKQCGNIENHKRWESLWLSWKETDPRIDVEKWKKALSLVVSRVIGLIPENWMGEVTVRQEIVEAVCKLVRVGFQLVRVGFRWDDSLGQGRSRVCQVVRKKVERTQVCKRFGVRVIGIYGVAGLGKTTMCEALCNDFNEEFKGRVAHVMLRSTVAHVESVSDVDVELMRGVLRKLTDTRHEVLDWFDNDECTMHLKMKMHQNNVFLAIDNVSATNEAIEEAQDYLRADFREGSVVIVIARSKEILQRVGVEVENCMKLPKLDTNEARSLFLHQLQDEINGEDEAFIMRCVKLCRFKEGDESGFSYLPLALKVFGLHIGFLGYDPKTWVEKLPDIYNEVKGSIMETLRVDGTWPPLMEVESWAEDEQPFPGDSGSGEGEPVEVDPSKHRVETPRNGSEVKELQAHASLNSSDEIQDEHGGQSNVEAELHVIDMVYADIPLNFEATKFELIMECFIASVEGIEAQVAEFLRLHSSNHIQVFNHECDSLVSTLSGTVQDRLRRYNNTLSLLQSSAGFSNQRRIFVSMAFCIVALAELERMFKAVVDLLTMCSKQDWWNTAFELSYTLPSHTIPRWSSFSLAIRSCEWSMDIVDFGFHALEQFLAGASTVTGVVFKWSHKQSRMVLHIDGKPLYLDKGGSSLLDVTRDLEGKDVTALIQKLVKLNETPRKWFSFFPGFSWVLGNIDTNMHSIADVLSQKLDGPRPEPNSLPYTFQVDPSTLKFVNYIGHGSFGMVAEYKWLGRTVSVKKVKSPGLSRKQFEMEAAILATVQHPRVVRMIGRAFEVIEGMGSLVMELMEDDLRHVIEKRCSKPARGVSPFPVRVAIDIMLQIGEGMQYLREHKILHRDLEGKECPPQQMSHE